MNMRPFRRYLKFEHEFLIPRGTSRDEARSIAFHLRELQGYRKLTEFEYRKMLAFQFYANADWK